MANWFQQHRLAWIAETLRVFGFINRAHLMRKFDISEPQASNDIAAFLRKYPESMAYDLSAKRYIDCRSETDARSVEQELHGNR